MTSLTSLSPDRNLDEEAIKAKELQRDRKVDKLEQATSKLAMTLEHL